MVDGQAIIDSLIKQMEDKKKEFETLNANMTELARQYGEQMTQLQTRREQVRGEYTALFNLYQQYKAPEEENKEEVKENKVVEMSKQKEKSKSVKSTTNKSVKQESTLTEEEVAKVKDQLAKQVNKNIKEEDIPDYLKEEYNK